MGVSRVCRHFTLPPGQGTDPAWITWAIFPAKYLPLANFQHDKTQPGQLCLCSRVVRKAGTIVWVPEKEGGMAVTLVAGEYGSSLSCRLGGRRMVGSFSPPRPVSCQRLCTSNLACAWLLFLSQPGQVTGFPSQPSRGLSLLPAALGHGWGAHVGLLPLLSKSSCLPSCWKGRESSYLLEEQQISLQRNGPSCTVGSAGLPVGWGCLAAIAGENSSSVLRPVTTTCHIHVLHSLIAIKAAKNRSKQDAFVLRMFWQESFVSNKWKFHKWKGNPLARQIQSLLLSLLKLNSTSE